MRRNLCAAIAAIFLSPLGAQEAPDDVRASILARCRTTFADYGASMVRSCADEDLRAYMALRGYSDEWSPIVTRCRTTFSEYGWAMIKSCADEDIAAEKALEDF